MGVPFPMQESYLGFLRDRPRHQLPPGFLWDMVDWIPQLDGAARRRFGWAALTASRFSDLNGASTNSGILCGYAPFVANGAEVVAVSSDGRLFKYNPSTGVGAVVTGAVSSGGGRPVFHREQLVIMSQSAELSFYPGNGAAIIPGSGTPHGACGTLYGDYTVIANTPGQPQRGFFSAPGDPRTYDLTNSWIDIPGVVVGTQGIRNALLFWTKGQIWRVRGDTPPQTNIIGNLVRDHLYDTGLVDERSIATYGEQVIFANTEGVWITDGAQVRNLTLLGGISTYWQSLLKSTYTSIVGGVYRGFYCVAISNGSTLVDFLVCELGTNQWFRFSNMAASMFAHGTAGSEGLYFVQQGSGLVGNLAPVWSTQGSTDQGGNVILPSLETPFFRGFQRLHRKWIQTDATSVWQRIYVNAEAPGTGSALRVGYTADPQVGGAYTTVGDIAAGSGLRRARLPINPAGGAIPARGIGFKIYQAPGMTPTDLRLSDIELEFFTREGSR